MGARQRVADAVVRIVVAFEDFETLCVRELPEHVGGGFGQRATETGDLLELLRGIATQRRRARCRRGGDDAWRQTRTVTRGLDQAPGSRRSALREGVGEGEAECTGGAEAKEFSAGLHV